MSEDTKKQRIAIVQKDGISMRLSYDFVTDAQFDTSLKELAEKMKYPYEHIVQYTLGDEEETQEGTLYFCPKCGYHNDGGYEPDVRMYYRQDSEGKSQPAGYFKTLNIDCTECDTVFEVRTEQFDADVEELNKAFSTNQN